MTFSVSSMLTAQVGWLAEKLGQKASDAALQAGRSPRRED